MDLIRLSFWSLISFFAIFGCANANILINEVELNPPGDDSGNEWIELYNSGDIEAYISGGKLVDDHYMHELTIPGGVTIAAKGYYTINWTNGTLINEKSENITLYTPDGMEIDRAIDIEDGANDLRAWQRIPDGGDGWQFNTGTPGRTNGGSDTAIPEFPSFIIPLLIVFLSIPVAGRFAGI